MVVGKVMFYMNRLIEGQAINLDQDVLVDSAKHFLDSGFDVVREEDIQEVMDQINSDEYPEFTISEIMFSNPKQYKLQRFSHSR